MATVPDLSGEGPIDGPAVVDPHIRSTREILEQIEENTEAP